MISQFEIAPAVPLGGDMPLIIAGPCVVENETITLETARRMKAITGALGLPYVFKASYDKANRTSASSFRSIGFDESLAILRSVKHELGLPILTDVHESYQVAPVADVVDIVQIPAFLCRQTDLLLEAGKSGRAVNIKRGQFMAPEDMRYAVDKVREGGSDRAFLTERGASFGYHNLVVDMRALPIMRQYAPVVFDVTHSVQTPGGAGGKSGGNREYAPFLARAAAGAGVDGFFIETHPNPAEALSDGPNMIPLDQMESFLSMLLAVWQTSRPFVARLNELTPAADA
ncbi:MAG: 3-deoxy-8-phosphooctulonate synthase [bacterium]|nr:3-deoxy-8-phosphooctulonate synthase [bacterium]